MNMTNTRRQCWEKFLFLISGEADNGKFLENVKRIRGVLGIPDGGLKGKKEIEEWNQQQIDDSDKGMKSPWFKSQLEPVDPYDPNSKKQDRELHKLLPINFLTYSIEDIVNENPDLKNNFKSAITTYILFGAIVPPSPFIVRERYKKVNGKLKQMYLGSLEYAPLGPEDHKDIKKLTDALTRWERKRMPKCASFNIEQDIKILKKTREKGQKIASKAPDIEPATKYNDVDIALEVLNEHERDGAAQKLRNKMRAKRKRAKDRLSQYFPNSSKS